MMLRLELPERRPRGQPKRRFMDVVKMERRMIGVSQEDAKGLG